MRFGIEVLKDQLEEMVKKKRLGHFVYALKSLSSDLRTECQALQPIFRMILEQPGCEFFVYAYVTRLAGHDTPFDTGEYPIHIAALSHQEANLKMLLSCQHSTVDQKTQPPANKTALELLCEQITQDTLQKTMKCLSVLLSYNANIPASWLDDSYPEASERQQFLKTLSQKCNIANNEVDDFDQTLDVLVTEAQWKVRELFQTRIFPNATESQTVPEGILLKCCKIGDYNMLKYLFETLTEDQLKRLLLAKKTNEAYVEENLLIVLMHRVNENDNDCPFYKCLTLCLSNPLIDIDDADRTERRALDYAAKYKLKRVQKLLLEKGAYVGGRDTFGRYALCNIDPIVLKQHLDSCIYTIGEGYDGRESNQSHIFVMLHNFIPPQCKTSHWKRSKKSWNASDKSILSALIEFTNESEISASNDINKETRLQLIEHPVVSTLLYIREVATSRWYIEVLKAVRALPFLLLVNGCFRLWDWASDQNMTKFTLVILFVLFLFEVIRYVCEIVWAGQENQAALWRELRQLRFYTMLGELALFVALMLQDSFANKSVLTIRTVLVGISLRRCMASYSKLANDVYNLDTVLTNICRSLAVYSFIFILLANILLENDQGTDQPSGQLHTDNVTTVDATYITLKSVNVWAKLLQTIALFTGELNTSEMQFNTWSAIAFVLFLIILTVAVNNLLGASAVADVSAIRKKSTQHEICVRTGRLWLYEQFSKFFGNDFIPHGCHDVHYVEMQLENDNQIKLNKLSGTVVDFPVNTSAEFAAALKNHIFLSSTS